VIVCLRKKLVDYPRLTSDLVKKKKRKEEKEKVRYFEYNPYNYRSPSGGCFSWYSNYRTADYFE